MFSLLMTIAAFDAIPTDMVYDDYLFGPQEGDPINEDFESVGFESIWILPNLGSLGWYVACIPFFYLLYFMTGICNRFSWMQTRRKKAEINIFWGLLIRITI